MRAASLLLLAALVVPAAAASDARLVFTDTFGQAAFEADGELQGGEANMVRGYMDLDKNGTVTADEATQFVGLGKSLVGQMVGLMLTGSNFTLDGQTPTAEIGTLQFEGAAGPVRGGGPIGFHLEMTFNFPIEEADLHTLIVVGHRTPGGVLHMTIELPEDWHLASVVGLEGVTAGADVHEVKFDMPTEGEEMQLRFAAAPKGSPAPGPLLALAAIGAALLVLRRRAGPAP